MTQIELASSMCPALVDLIHANDAPIDRIEIGPWFTVETIRDLYKQLPDWKFHMHDGNTHMTLGSFQDALDQMRVFQDETDSPFISLHISLTLPGMVRIRKYGLPIPRLPNSFMEKRLIQRAKQVKTKVGVPVILENMPGFPKYTVEADPERITAICEETDCGMLLDMGHARCGADNLNMDIYDYLSALPLQRVQQIHAHSPRLGRWNKLEDAHEPMQEVDYEIFTWLLDHCQPRIVTLEYWKDKDAIREQLYRLRAILDSK